jgi:hypothetical protein
MFQVIAAIFGFATSADKSATAQYMQGRQENNDSINFSRNKDLILYSANGAQLQAVGIILFVLILGIVWVTVKNKN